MSGVGIRHFNFLNILSDVTLQFPMKAVKLLNTGTQNIEH